MRAKILTAVFMPIVVAAFCAGLLAFTHHTTMPPLTVPSIPTAPPSPRPTVSLGHNLKSAGQACRGSVPHPFAGIAVKNDITSHVASFRRATGVRVRVIEYYNHFPGKFQKSEAEQAVENGAEPFIQLNPRNVKLSQIADGSDDAEIKAYASAVKAFSCHVILSFGHEMNGWWYNWGLPQTSPALYKLAWRRVFDIFEAARVKNVTWSWDPTHQHERFNSQKAATLASNWYPGDKYVDIIGIDGYLNPNQNFAEVFQSALADIRSVTHKPIFIAETGVAPTSLQGQQITDLFAGMKHYNLNGLIWFENVAKHHWPLENRPAADRVYHDEVAKFPR